MSKVIKLTDQVIEELKNDFSEALKSLKLSDGKFTFTKTFGAVDRKATLYFTENAWLKQSALVREFNKEVAWHGIAKRGDDPEKDEYIIEDILVYPQEVTGATVTTDQEKYQTWLYEHDDEVFNNIRMQGHSHVNMSTSPSAVDTSLYDRILAQLDDSMFYIFLIWNKRDDKTIKIYDLQKNVLFDTSDITVEVLEDENGYQRFINEAKELVVDKPVTTTNTAWKGGSASTSVTKYEDNKSSDTDFKKGKKKDSKSNYSSGYGYGAYGYNSNKYGDYDRNSYYGYYGSGGYWND